MPKGRIIQTRICESKKLALLKTDGARLLYTWLIPNADIEGRFGGDPLIVKSRIFTRLRKSVATVQKYLDDLAANDLITLYRANGDTYLQINNFTTMQPKLNPSKEAESAIPAPTPDLLQTYSRVSPPKVKVKISKDKDDSIFDDARKLYPGTKRGCSAELTDFQKKHKDWREVIPLLKPAIEAQIAWRQHANGEFRPPWKHFKTWLNQRCWTEEHETKSVRKNAVCRFCGAEATITVYGVGSRCHKAECREKERKERG
jgi:hypothetical protein